MKPGRVIGQLYADVIDTAADARADADSFISSLLVGVCVSQCAYAVQCNALNT